jgi:AAA domain, putative AbiEii toxin, Type IV TA system
LNAQDSKLPVDEQATQYEPNFFYSLSRISFSDGSSIALKRGEVLVVVGPNNAGKSVALREIVQQLDANPPPKSDCVVVKDIDVDISLDQVSLADFRDKLEPVRVGGQADQIGRMGQHFGRNLFEYWWSLEPSARKAALRMGLRAMTTYIVNTENRLQVTATTQSIDLSLQQKSHPFHYLYDDITLEDQLSKIFRKAFGTDLIVNRTAGSVIHLHVGDRPYPSLTYNTDQASRSALKGLPKLNEQGDGMRAFVGCLMWASVINFNLVLIDEPEAFLHPPQARLLGRTLINRKQSNSQLVVSTHSGDLLRGILDSNYSALRIVRLVREGTQNRATELKPDDITAILGESLLKHTNVLEALFHQRTVICESDSDCLFYSSILNATNDKSEDTPAPDVLFLQSGGKHRIPAVLRPLRTLGVPVRVVVDFDVLRELLPLRSIFELLGGHWQDIESDWKVVNSAISNLKSQIDKTELTKAIADALSKVQGTNVPEATLKQIREAVRSASAWSFAKKSGAAFVPAGAASVSYRSLDVKLRKHGLFIVPCGELESFCKTVPSHGPEWVQEVCKRNLSADAELMSARDFVSAVMS